MWEKDVYVYLAENGKWEMGEGGEERRKMDDWCTITANMRQSWVFLDRLI